MISTRTTAFRPRISRGHASNRRPDPRQAQAGYSARVPAKRRERLKQTVAAADKLMMLLELFSDEVGRSCLRRCRKEIDGLISYIENVPPKLLTSLGVKEKKSAFVILVGRGLAHVFKSHSFGKPGWTRRTPMAPSKALLLILPKRS